MALKPMTPAQDVKTTFVKGPAGRTILPTPRQNRVRGGEESENYGINLLLFGPVGSGKTRALVGLLKAGLKVLVLVSDIGNNGLITVKLALKKEGREDLLKNFKFINLEGHEDATAFLDEPATFFPEVYTWGVDVIFWDGWSAYQSQDLLEYVGGLVDDAQLGGKEVSEVRAEGVQLSMADYGVLRNVTVRVVKKFTQLHNKQTGQLWHHIITCHEAIASQGDGKGGFKDTSKPFLTGSAQVYLTGAFDVIIKTQVVGNDENTRKYEYVIEGTKNLIAKNRGFSLPPVMEGDMEKLWLTLEADLGITRGAVNPANITPVLVGDAA
jgi:hypothetical protein